MDVVRAFFGLLFIVGVAWLFSKDKKSIQVLLRTNAVKDESQNVIGIIEIFTDITGSSNFQKTYRLVTYDIGSPTLPEKSNYVTEICSKI